MIAMNEYHIFLERIYSADALMQYYPSVDFLMEDVSRMSYADLLEALISGYLSEAMGDTLDAQMFDTPLKVYLSEFGRKMFHDENLTIDNVFEISK